MHAADQHKGQSIFFMEKLNVMLLSAASSRQHEAVGRKEEALIEQSFSKGQVKQALYKISKEQAHFLQSNPPSNWTCLPPALSQRHSWNNNRDFDAGELFKYGSLKSRATCEGEVFSMSLSNVSVSVRTPSLLVAIRWSTMKAVCSRGLEYDLVSLWERGLSGIWEKGQYV